MPSRVIFLLYRAVLVLAFPFIVAYVIFRCLKDRAYLETAPERFGFLPGHLRAAAPGSIWLHAVSVGEVISSARLITGLREAVPGAKIYVSVGTLAGRQLAEQRLSKLADGIFYAPLDFVWVVRHVIRRLRPALVMVMETEIWPNMWRETKRSGAGLLVVNARISDRAMPRYRAWRWFFAPVLRLSDRILAQSGISRGRYIELGAAPERVDMGGNLKYDFDASVLEPPEAILRWARATAPGLLWLAASTMPPARDGDVDEDEAVLDMHRRLSTAFPALRLILVPRRPERFDTAAQALERRGIAYVRRSTLPANATPPSVLLLDSLGELASTFRLADVVFMGGTLCDRGGHNILEPACFAKPVVTGPHMENFPEIAADFDAAGAYIRAKDAAGVEAALGELLNSSARREELGKLARQEAMRKTGATASAIEAAKFIYERSLPRPFPSVMLSALAALWCAGSRWKRRRDLAARAHLDRPVISVGGVCVGGVGKTPMAMRLAEIVRDAGRAPAFLTRGYRRISQEFCTVVPTGGQAPVEHTGDEAQLLVRSGLGPVGICRIRARAGQAVVKQFNPDLFILDDGFQHARLVRSTDLVLIDTLDPFGGFRAIPAGRLREPLEALARASAFVLMRAEQGRTYDGIVAVLRSYNPSAPIFRARFEPAGWADAFSGTPVEGPGGPGGAFCGLGNPASFWRTLERLDLRPLFQTRFPDHHRYHPRDLRRLGELARQAGASVLWTTEKDAMNLPPGWPRVGTGPRVLTLRIAVQMEDETEFAGWLRNRLA